MSRDDLLPSGFLDLAPLLDEWGDLATQDERYCRRKELSMVRLQAYYDLVQPRLTEIFDHLDRFPYGPPLPEAEARLFRLVMAMAEVAQAVEVYGQPAVPNLPRDATASIQFVERV